MNRHLTFSLAVSMTVSALAIPLRAANKPRAGGTEKIAVLWTNEGLEHFNRRSARHQTRGNRHRHACALRRDAGS